MDKRTLEALKASIAKWERNAEAETPAAYTVYAQDCPLCALFCEDFGSCQGCPVQQKTRRSECRHTPWGAAVRAWARWVRDRDNEDLRTEAHAAARKEVEFLKSLLPEESDNG